MKPKRIRVKGWPDRIPDEVVAQVRRAQQLERGELCEHGNPPPWYNCAGCRKGNHYSFTGNFR